MSSQETHVLFLPHINTMSETTTQQPTFSETKFYSSKQLVEMCSASKCLEIFFRADAIKKTYDGRPYVQPIAIKSDGERHDDIDCRFNLNLNNGSVDVIKRNSFREYWVVCIDASTVKRFVDREGISHDFYPSETMFVMNARTIAKLKEIECARQPAIGYVGEF